MSLWKIAWRSIQQRWVASSLTAFSMALGVSLVVTVLVIHQVIDQSFRRSAQGYDLVVGAKGGALELVLNAVYYIGDPGETIPYRCYQDFLPGGKYYPDLEENRKPVPICMGDSFEGFLVIGTIPERFTDLQYLDGQNFTFAAGRNFKAENFYEAVLGAEVAKTTGLKVGSELKPTHGQAGNPEGHVHRPFQVVGVLAATGTPVDRAVYVNIEGFYHLEGHARPAEKDEHHAPGDKSKPAAAAHDDHDADHEHHHDPDAPVPDSEKRITCILVCVKGSLVRTLAQQVNEDPLAQAAAPAQVISELLNRLIGNVQVLLLILAVLVVVVAGIGILVSIYNSMNDRRREIAIMRALGARRWIVMVVILLESILLSLGGGAIGVLLGHGLIGPLAPAIQEYAGMAISPLQFQPVELVLVPGLIVLAALVGYLPAAVAYRTDVARSLVGTQ